MTHGDYILTRYAVLCGSAPADFRQKKLVDMHDFLTSETGGSVPERSIILFPNGVSELMLENVLNNAFDVAAEEGGAVLLYMCAFSESDLHAELSDSYVSEIEVIRLRDDEIRKEVIAYYADLAEKLGVSFQVMYEADSEFVNEETLGYEKVGEGRC